ncbi:unnamed protein product [Spirodela intermedia]|uniref:Uncharacterized protein n=1 Tax=Spirodela intermedia TaxID=51605 RepID=A0A7I8JD30_SPIIN|nr:unnamed protein product [Spirodela intermedia]CAA6668050.1 unnamed protein product [Spirodela intermedia]
MIRKISSSPSLATVDLSGILHAFSNGLMCRVVTGNCPEREVWSERFREAIDESTALLSRPRLEELFPSLAWLDVLLDEIMTDHERRAGRRDQAEEVDFLDHLLSADTASDYAFSREDLKAICLVIFTIVFPSRNSSASGRTPRTCARLGDGGADEEPSDDGEDPERSEGGRRGRPAPTEDDVARMPHLRAMVKEVLRLHMPAPLLLPRESMEATRVLGYDVPAGTRVFINAWAMARDPQWWEAPEEFRPESDFQFLPFGTGRRMCPGMNFALCVVELALAGLLYHFDWSLPAGTAPEDLDMTSRDKCGHEGRVSTIYSESGTSNGAN